MKSISMYSIGSLLSLRKNIANSNVVSQKMIKRFLSSDVLQAFCKLQSLSAFQTYNSKRNVAKALEALDLMIKDNTTGLSKLPNLTASYKALETRKLLLSDALTKLEACLVKYPEATEEFLSIKAEVPSVLFYTSDVTGDKLPIISVYKNTEVEAEDTDSFFRDVKVAVKAFTKQQHIDAAYERKVYLEDTDAVTEARSIVPVRDVVQMPINANLLLGAERYNFLRGALTIGLEQVQNLQECQQILDLFKFQERILNLYQTHTRKVIYAINVLFETGVFEDSDKGADTEAAVSAMLYKLNKQLSDGTITPSETSSLSSEQSSSLSVKDYVDLTHEFDGSPEHEREEPELTR